MRTVIHLKADKDVKENAQKVAIELGLTLSDVINASLRNFIRTREVYFSAVPKITEELERLLGVVEEDLKHKRNFSDRFKTVKEALSYLDAQ